MSPKIAAAQKDWNPSPQELFASYWTLEPGWSTELEMRNNIPWRELRITPVLRTAEGTEVPLAPLNLKPDEIVSVNLQEAVALAKPGLSGKMGSFGSVVVRFEGTARSNAFAASVVRRQGHPIDFHFDAELSGSQALEGMWWLPSENATDYLILSNPTSKPVTARVTLSEASGAAHRFSLAMKPAQSQRINIREMLRAPARGALGGLSLSVTKPGTVLASEIVFDEVTGLAAVMKLFDRESDEKVSMHVLRAPMMALSQPDPRLAFPEGTVLIPRIFVRNTGSAAMTISGMANWRGESTSGKSELPRLALTPGQAKVINLTDIQKSAQIAAHAFWSTITLIYTGRTADLIAVAVSYDKDGRYGLQTPFTEGTNRLFKGSMWHVDGTHNTLITTGNGGSEPTKAQVTLFYNGGQGKYRVEKPLVPGQQILLDVGQLIRNQVPDSDGKTIPPDTMFGSYELRDLDHPILGLLYEGKLVVDKTFGHASYGCGRCCGYQGTRLIPTPFLGQPGINNQDESDAYDVCNAFWDDVTSITYNWHSNNTAVATLPNRTLHTVAAGTATGSVQETLPTESKTCYDAPTGADKGVTVTCPASTTVNSLYALSITLLFPSLKTGIGAVATMGVGLTTTNWNGYQITESVTTYTNSCPSSWGNICPGSSTFTVGAGGQAQVLVNGVETPVGPVFTGHENIFYDQHTATKEISMLDWSGINSCTAVCSQTYSCSGQPIGNDKITYSFIKAQINGTHVTSTEVSKQ